MPLTVRIRTTGGQEASVTVAFSETVASLKDRVERSTALGAVRELCCRGRLLDDAKTLADLGLESHDVLIATVKTGGGSPALRHRSTAPSQAVPSPAESACSGDASAPPRSRKKCFQCGASLNLVQQNMPCRCQGVFCDRHRPYESHACSFDHAMLARAQLTQDLYCSTAPGQRGAASGRAQSAFVYSEYCKTHRSALCRGMHAAGFTSLAVALLLSVGADWDGIGVPTWVKRLLTGITVSYTLSYFGHTHCPSEHGPAFCIWSSKARTHPFQCLVCEVRNLVRCGVDLATGCRTNFLTPHLERFKHFYDPLH